MSLQLVKNMWKALLNKLFWGGFRHFLSDHQYARFRYWLELDQRLNLENPKRFTEKIQFIKLYERTELRRRVADRTLVRNFVEKRAGEEPLIPLIGIYDELTPDIWESLPEQFVLKANHGCGMIKIIRDKKSADYTAIYDETEKWKNTDYYKLGREWVYKVIPRTLVAETLILDSNGSIPSDYKFFCFNGKVELIQVDIGRFTDQKRNLYDRDFNRVDAELLYPPYEGTIEKPALLDDAIRLAEKLSTDFNFIRTDLYILDQQIWFGELTNYPGNGFIPFKPESMEIRMGSLLNL